MCVRALYRLNRINRMLLHDRQEQKNAKKEVFVIFRPLVWDKHTIFSRFSSRQASALEQAMH
jgi:hypothetical protein